MKRSEREAASSGSSFLSHLSLPAVRSTVPFEGADILDELPSATGLVLCRGYRAVMAWALALPRERAALFTPGADEEVRDALDSGELPVDLRAAVETVRDLLADPAGVDPRRVADACVAVTDWAEREEDAPATALRFVQAAGMCLPDDARLGYRAGCAARRRGSWDIAELWYRHASTVGRRRHDWEGHALAYLGLGNSYLQQGKYAAAHREHTKALRVGNRHRLPDIRRRAYHDLFLVSMEAGASSRAEEYAQAAFRAYGSGHPRLPALAHDIAYFWNLQGCFARALPVFQALLLHFHRAADRVRVLASVVRAAGGAGDLSTFADAWRESWELAPGLGPDPVLTTSFMQMAYGASSLADWELARQAAEQALLLARQRGEEDVVASAEATLRSVLEHQMLESEAGARPTTVDSEEADTLARELVTSLESSAR